MIPDDDQYEPNDVAAEAVTLTPGMYLLQGLNDDWFHVRLETAATLRVAIAGTEGDLDLAVYLPDGTIAQSASATSDEQVEQSSIAGDVFVQVWPNQGATSNYVLEISVPEEVCNAGPCGAGCGMALIGAFLGLAPLRRRT